MNKYMCTICITIYQFNWRKTNTGPYILLETSVNVNDVLSMSNMSVISALLCLEAIDKVIL